MHAYLISLSGQATGLFFVDSTPLKVCHSKRIHSHKVFKNIAKRGKSSTGWFYGFKLHVVVNDCGELVAFMITSGSVDDRKTVPEMCKDLTGKLIGDKGYISKNLFSELITHSLQLITKTGL